MPQPPLEISPLEKLLVPEQNTSEAVRFVLEAAQKRRRISTQQAQELQRNMGLETKKHLVRVK